MNGGMASRISRRAHSAPEPGGPERLVATEDEEVAVERLDVDRPVGHRLRAVDEHQRAGVVGLARSSRFAGLIVPRPFDTA